MVTLIIYLEQNLELCSAPLTPAVEFSILDMCRLMSVLHFSVSSAGIKIEYICITYFGSTPEIANKILSKNFLSPLDLKKSFLCHLSPNLT